jgi:phosphate transport system substrate-binding protein
MKILFALSLIMSVAACNKGNTNTITISGSTSVQPFAEQWAEKYEAAHTDIKINVQGGGSSQGIQSVVDGTVPIGMSSRELKPEEIQKGLKGTIIAKDGISVIVNTQNAVSDLPLDKVQAIFKGEITNWKDVGGADQTIHLIVREAASGTRSAFEELVMEKKLIASSAMVQDSSGALKEQVKSDPTSIGFLSMGLVDSSIKALKLAGVDANDANIEAGTYPLVRPFLFVTKGDPSASSKAFIDYVLSPEGQKLAKDKGLIPVAK